MRLVGSPANVSTLTSTRLSVLIQKHRQNSQEEDAKYCFKLTYAVGQVGTDMLSLEQDNENLTDFTEVLY